MTIFWILCTINIPLYASSFNADVISVPSVVTTTPGYRPSTPITGSSLPSSASVLTQNLQITHTTESSNPTTHSDSHTTKLKNNSNLAISSLAQTSMYITSSQINSTTNSTSATNTNYLTSPVIKEPALQGSNNYCILLVPSLQLVIASYFLYLSRRYQWEPYSRCINSIVCDLLGCNGYYSFLHSSHCIPAQV